MHLLAKIANQGWNCVTETSYFILSKDKGDRQRQPKVSWRCPAPSLFN